MSTSDATVLYVHVASMFISGCRNNIIILCYNVMLCILAFCGGCVANALAK